MKKLKNLYAIFCAFFAHIGNFVSDPTLANFSTEKENYARILRHSGLENFNDDFDNLEDLDDLDTDNLEDLDEGTKSMFKDFENLVEDYQRRGMSRNQARTNANSRMKAKSGNRWINAVKNKKKNTLIGGGGLRGTVAEFKVLITRWGTNVPYDLPVVLFAPMHLENNYQKALSSVNSNVRITQIVRDTINGNLQIYYQAVGGGLTDMLLISCEETAYLTLLESLKTDLVYVANTRLIVADADVDQFTRNWTITKNNGFGKGTNNTINIERKRSTKDYIKSILDVDNPYHLDKETAITFGVKRNLASQGISFNCSVAGFYRHDRNSVKGY